jgi:hypothetical protein
VDFAASDGYGIMVVDVRQSGAGPPTWRDPRCRDEEGKRAMAAMKPRTGDGPLEVTKEGRGIVLRMPLEGGGRLVVEMTPEEVRALGEAIDNCEGLN